MSRIGVAGGTGLTGRHVVHALRHSGHQAVVLSRASGVDLMVEAGLADALRGATAVIDVTNIAAAGLDDACAFFGVVTQNMLAAEQQAGVRHHVVLSIAEVDRVEGNWHCRHRGGARPCPPSPAQMPGRRRRARIPISPKRT